VVSSAPRPAQPLPASSSSPDLEKVRPKSTHLIFSIDLNPYYFPLIKKLHIPGFSLAVLEPIILFTYILSLIAKHLLVAKYCTMNKNQQA